MDVLLNPNIAYFVLVFAFLLGVFSLLAPGTGVFELGALFAFVISGYYIYTLPINGWALFVLILGVFPFLLALRRTRRQSNLAVSALALTIGSAFLFRGPEWWQPGVNPLLAAVVSISSGGLLWLIAVKVMKADAAPLSHDLSKIVGELGEAKTDIHDEGSVQVNRELWTARSDEPIKVGAQVKVVSLEGFVLHVVAVDKNDG